MAYTGYFIFAIGLLILFLAYLLYRKFEEERKIHVTARDIDLVWKELGKYVLEVSENNMHREFLKDLDHLVRKSNECLALPSKNHYADESKIHLRGRLRDLAVEMKNASAPYRVEIRKYRLRNLAKLLGIQLP